MNMMQGDSRGLRVNVLNEEKVPITPDDVINVEIMVGSIRKTYEEGGVRYDEAKKQWILLLTQQETFQFPAGSRMKAQVRVVWLDGTVEGKKLGHINVDESISKEVL